MATWADWLRFSILAMVVIWAGVHDVRRGRAPNRLTIGAMVAGLVLALVIGLIRLAMGEPPQVITQELAAAMLGLLAGLIPMAILFFSGAMGGADVKMMAAVGAISASWPVAFETFVNAFVAAAVMAVVIMIRRRLVRQSMSRLWGAMLSAMARSRPTFHGDSPTVPFLVAVAAGAILAAGRHLLGWPIPWGLDVR